MSEIEYNARPLGVKEDNKLVKFYKQKVQKTAWWERVQMAFIGLIYSLPVALIVYVLIYFFNR